MSRKPVPHDRPAAPPFLPSWGHRGGCIIGRPVKDDPTAIQRMVNMLAADPSLSVRAAANAVGTHATNAERLRKRYRTLKRKGQLPSEETEASRLALRADAIREMYAQRANRLENMTKDLADAEKKAKALKLDTSPASLAAQIHNLEAAREVLETLAHSSPDVAYDLLVHQGVTDPEQAIQTIAEAPETLKSLAEKIDVLKKIYRLRPALGQPLA